MRKVSLLVIGLLLLVLSAVPAFAQGTIVDLAVATPDLSTLVAAVGAAESRVADALAGPGPLTVFAPSNAAFVRLDGFLQENFGIGLDAVIADQEILTNLLLYHVVQGNVFSNQLQDGQIIPTLLGGGSGIGVAIRESGLIQLNNVVEIDAADIRASNGVVHVINDVLLPGQVVRQIEELAGATAAAATPTSFVNVRVGHFAQARAVDVYVDGAKTLERLQPGDVTDFLRLGTGSYEIVVTNASGSIENPVIGPVTLDLSTADEFVTVAAVGSTDAGTLDAIVLRDTYTGAAEGAGSVTVVHAIPDAGTVRVLANGEPLVRSIIFPQALNYNVPAGTYDVQVVTTVAGSEVVLADLPGVEISALTYYTIVAYGSAAEPDVFVSSVNALDVARINNQ